MRLSAVIISLLFVTQMFGAQAQEAEAPRPARVAPLATRAVFLDIAINQGSVIAVGERGIILRSDDQGDSWRQIPSPVDVTLTAVTFSDPRTGWAVGHESTILKTVDGGASWQVVRYKPEEERYYLNVWFKNVNQGVVLGTDGELWSTHDGGENWSVEILSVEEWYQNHLFAFHELADNSAVIAAERGGVFARSTGETKWRVVESPYPGTFFGVTELGGQFLLFGMSGKAYQLELRSAENEVDQWREVDTSSDQFLLAATTAPESGHVVLVGRGGIVLEVGADGTVIHNRQRPNRVDITAIAVDARYVYLASMRGGIERLVANELFASVSDATAND